MDISSLVTEIYKIFFYEYYAARNSTQINIHVAFLINLLLNPGI